MERVKRNRAGSYTYIRCSYVFDILRADEGWTIRGAEGAHDTLRAALAVAEGMAYDYAEAEARERYGFEWSSHIDEFWTA